MNGSLLRTGTVRDYHPLGAVGNPVYLSAPQLRAAIGRRLGREVADILAIPQRNEDGDTIDWYAPAPGSVVPWSAATPEERARAKAELMDARGAIEGLAETMQAEIRTDHQVFGRLLRQVTAFPDDEHLYLVDDRPVMTFWGFHRQDAPIGSDPLLDLPPPAPVAEAPPARWRWWWLVPPLLLLALVAGYLLLPEPEPVETPLASMPTQVPPPASDAAATPADEPAAAQQPEGPGPEPATSDRQPADRPVRSTETLLRGTDHWVAAPDGGPIDRDTTTTLDSAVPPGTAETPSAGATSAPTDLTGTPAPVLDQTPPQVEPPVGTIETAPAESDQQTAARGLEEPAEAVPETVSDTETAKPGTDDPPPDLTQTPETPLPGEAQVPQQKTEQAEANTEEKLEQTPPEKPAPELTQEPKAPPRGEPEGPGSNEKEKETMPERPAPVPAQKPAPADSRAEPKPPPRSPQAQKPGAGGPGGGAEPLRIPAEAIATGSTRFLNGGWQSATSLQDPSTSLPVEMSYRLEDGAGQVQLRRYDGSLCTTGAQAVMRNGKLIIDSAEDIRCPGGANFGRPRMECVPGKDGRAECAGRYESGESFSVGLNRTPEAASADRGATRSPAP
jgi:hypothetical protein